MKFVDDDDDDCIVGTVFIRFAMFPLVILGQRNAAEMRNHMPTMQRLQMRMLQARQSGDVHAGFYIFVFSAHR